MPGVGFVCTWAVDAIGRRHIVASCERCRRRLGYVQQAEPYTTLAGPPPVTTAAAGLEGRAS
jgi:hypothetical protein